MRWRSLDGLVEVVYPAMLDEYESRVTKASPASDGPLALAGRRAASDLGFTVAAGGRLLGRLRGTATPPAGVATTARLQRLLAGAGGPFGDTGPPG